MLQAQPARTSSKVPDGEHPPVDDHGERVAEVLDEVHDVAGQHDRAAAAT